MQRRPRKYFTSKQIAHVIKLWPNYTNTAIAKKMKRDRYSILVLAKRIREQGYNLPKKSEKDDLNRRIKNALGDVSSEKRKQIQ